jgi:hypothetical protein
LLSDGSIRPVAPNLQVYDANLVAIPEERASFGTGGNEFTEHV